MRQVRKIQAFAFVASVMLAGCMSKPIHEALELPNPAEPAPNIVAPIGTTNMEVISTPLSGSGRALSSIERTLSGGILEIGHSDAHGTMTLFVAPASTYSRLFLTQQWPNVLREFTDKGILKIRIVPFILQKDLATRAHAKAMICAAKQGRGRMMLEALARGIRPTQAMKDVNADTVSFDTCLTDLANDATIGGFEELARMQGITLVPSMVLNGEVHTGLAEEPDLHGWIRESLKQN